MNKKLKGIIFSIGDVLAPKHSINNELVLEVKKLILFLRSKGIQPVILANREVFYNGQSVESLFRDSVGQFPWFMTLRDNLPRKPSKGAIDHVLNTMNWDSTETAYVGCNEDDMRTAVNAKVLFLNALWFNSSTEYGIKFETPKEIARFVEVFCLADHLWGFSIEDDGLEMHALGTFSTYYPEFADYSSDARSAAKSGSGNLDFWTKYLWSRIYFSELYKEIDLITSYPGHRANYESIASSAVQEPLESFGKCFRIEYLNDLIIRHTTSVKSQTARNEGKAHLINHCNQLNTICLNPAPIKNLGKGLGKPYNKFSLKGKTVLVVDDITTEGFSLEAARVYCKMAGASRVVLLAWLKTIKSPYCRISRLPQAFDPFNANHFTEVDEIKTYDYRNHVNRSTAAEITEKFNKYRSWNWDIL